jgi:hypothetical protein
LFSFCPAASGFGLLWQGFSVSVPRACVKYGVFYVGSVIMKTEWEGETFIYF